LYILVAGLTGAKIVGGAIGIYGCGRKR